MKIILAAAIAFMFVYTPSRANGEKYASAFFSQEEMRMVDEAVREKFGGEDPNLIKLGAIIYFSPQNWTIWLQGKKWTPKSDSPEIHVIEVTSSHVRLSLSVAGFEKSREITLRPNQSFDLLTGDIREGR